MSAPCQIWVPQTSHLIKYFWIRMVTTLTDSVLPLANYIIMHQIPYLRKHWLTRRWKREQAQTFSIYLHVPYMHFSVCSLLLVCSVQIWYGQCSIWAKSMLKYWFILICPMSSVDQSLHSQKCYNQEIWNCNADQKTFLMIHTKINCYFTYWNGWISDFLPFYW